MSLESQFEAAMFDVYRRAKDEAGYNATIFLKMVTDQGGLATARQLINAPRPSDGYTHLYERGRLDLTVEALVIGQERWKALFSDAELDRAKRRLGQYGYAARTD